MSRRLAAIKAFLSATLLAGAGCMSAIDEPGSALSSFGFNLFLKLCEKSPADNVVLSPFVVAGALSMATAGATTGGKAEQELLDVLGFKSHEEFALLSKAVLASDGASVSAANGMFTRKDIRHDYVSLVASTHGAFADKLGDSYAPINKWVEEQTQGKIQDLLADPVDPLMVAVLVSAVFFKGAWADKFDAALTQQAPFTAVDERKLRAGPQTRWSSAASLIDQRSDSPHARVAAETVSSNL